MKGHPLSATDLLLMVAVVLFAVLAGSIPGATGSLVPVVDGSVESRGEFLRFYGSYEGQQTADRYEHFRQAVA